MMQIVFIAVHADLAFLLCIAYAVRCMELILYPKDSLSFQFFNCQYLVFASH